MRNVVYCLLLLWGPCCAFQVEDTDLKNRMDSLDKALRHLPAREKGRAMVDLGKFYWFTNTSRAVELYREAEPILKSFGDSSSLKTCYMGLAVCYDLLEAYDSAEVQYKKGFAIAGRDSVYLASVYTNFGIFNANRQRFKEALTYQLKALGLNEKTNNKRKMLSNYGNIAYVHDCLGNYAQAARFDTLAYRMAIETGATESAFVLLANLGVALRYLGHVADAKRCIRRAVHYYETTSPTSTRLANQYVALATVYNAEENLDSAYFYHMKSLSLLKPVGPTTELATAYYELAQNLLLSKKIDEAESYAQQSIRLFERFEDLNGQKQASFTLMKIYLHKGDKRLADRFEQNYQELEDSIEQQAQENAVLDIQTRYETGKKQQENEMLRKDMKLKTYELEKKNYILLSGALGLSVMLAIVFVIVSKSREKILLNKILHQENQALKVENLTAQLNQLKEQVNPHFLFNSLASLQSMVADDDPKAGQFIVNLADVYRYILQTDASVSVSLRKELEIANSYLFTLKTRFDESLQVSIEIDASVLDEKIPPFSLQLLIENAVKHNLATPLSPLKIELFVSDKRLYVRNTLQPRRSVVESTKVGLANLTQRYRLLGQDDIEVEKDDKFFLVSLPLLT